MQLSKKKINQRIEKQIFNIFYQVIADVKNPQEAKVLLENILTRAELEAFSKRLAVAHYLERGRSYENIKNALKVSSATIATVAEKMQKGKGYEIALKKIRAEEWADRWTKKISKLVKGGK